MRVPVAQMQKNSNKNKSDICHIFNKIGLAEGKNLFWKDKNFIVKNNQHTLKSIWTNDFRSKFKLIKTQD